MASTSGWYPVARANEIDGVPREVEAAGHRYVAFRPAPGADVAVVAARCPHRLVRLDHARPVTDGGAVHLECPYHGWRFDAAGRCVLVPSNGPGAAVPERAHLDVPWGVREYDGTLWVAPVHPSGQYVPGTSPGPGAVPDPAELLTNDQPVLARGWHPVATVAEVPDDGSPLDVRLLGHPWSVRRAGRAVEDGFDVDPVPYAVAERFGVVWIAPAPPLAGLLDVPDDADPDFAGAWLPPERSASPAGVLAENFLDVAHFPFVHAGTFGAAEEREVEPFEVALDAPAGELTSVQDQWFDNPEDPGVVAGLRPVRQRRRASYRYRVPFQLVLRLEELDAGAVKTILFFLQPEDAGSTRIYTKMVLSGIGGVTRPGPDVVAAEVAFEQAVLAEDLALQRAMTVTGLPLRLRDELHVRSDRSGVALRRIWRHHLRLP